MFKKMSALFSKKGQMFDNLVQYRFDNSYFIGKGQAVWMERDYKTFANEAYMKNVVAHRSIEMISQSASSVSLRLYHGYGRGKKEIVNHDIITLLKKPNPMSNGKSLLQNFYSYALIHGNAYILAIKGQNQKPRELITLRPDRVCPIADDNFIPMGYRYTVGEKIVDYPVNQMSGHSDIMHWKSFHPLSDWFGLSAVEAASYSIDQHNQASHWNQALLQNGARPSGALVVKGSSVGNNYLTEEQYQRLKSSIEESMSGAQNAGKPLLLEGGLEWQDMSLSPRDMDFIESKNSAARDIALAFGVPPQLLGIPGDNTYSNLIEARIALWEQTIIPLLDNVTERLSNWLCGFYESGLEISYDLDNVPALSAKREAIWNRIDKASFMSDDEKRAALGLVSTKNR